MKEAHLGFVWNLEVAYVVPSPLRGEGEGGGEKKWGCIGLTNKLVNTARTLRKRQTDAERLLWKHLRAKRMEGCKFRRQQPIGDYVVDFMCLERSLVVEVDGGQHADNRKDEERDAWLASEGFKVLRFWNNEVLTNLEGVLRVIRESCLNHPPLTPPLKGGESND